MTVQITLLPDAAHTHIEQDSLCFIYMSEALSNTEFITYASIKALHPMNWKDLLFLQQHGLPTSPASVLLALP